MNKYDAAMERGMCCPEGCRYAPGHERLCEPRLSGLSNARNARAALVAVLREDEGAIVAMLDAPWAGDSPGVMMRKARDALADYLEKED